MFVIPVSPALNVDSEQNSYKAKNNPAFGLQLTRDTKLFLKKAREFARENPDSTFTETLAKLCTVIRDLTSKDRRNDGLQLDIRNPEWGEGLKPFTIGAQVKLENIVRAVGGKARSLTKIITNIGDPMKDETVMDVALRLLTDINGKALPPNRLNRAIENARKRFKDGVEFVHIQVVEPLKTRISDEMAPNLKRTQLRIVAATEPFTEALGNLSPRFNEGIEQVRLRIIEGGEPLRQKIIAAMPGNWATETQVS